MTRNTAARLACLLALAVVSPLLAANDRPVVTLPTVEQGGQVKGSVPVDVVWKPADDGIAVVKLDLSIDDQPVITFDLQPKMRHVQYNWDTSTWADGKHTVVVQVEDAQGRQRSYRTFVYVRNHDLPAAARDTNGSRIEIEDLDGNPDNVITQRALIRVRVNPEMGAKWVVLFLNGQFIAMMNYPPYEFRLDPAKRKLQDGPYVVQAKVIQPDNSEVYPESVKVTLNVNGQPTRIQPPLGVEPGGRAPGSEVAPAIATPRPGAVPDQPGTVEVVAIPLPGGAQPAPEPGKLNVDTGGRPVLTGGQPALPAAGPATAIPGMADAGRGGQVIVPTTVLPGPLPPKSGPSATHTRMGPLLPPMAGAGQALAAHVRDTMVPGQAGSVGGGAHLGMPRERIRRQAPLTGAAAVKAADLRSAAAAALAANVASEGPVAALPGRRVVPRVSPGPATPAGEAGAAGAATAGATAVSGRPSMSVPGGARRAPAAPRTTTIDTARSAVGAATLATGTASGAERGQRMGLPGARPQAAGRAPAVAHGPVPLAQSNLPRPLVSRLPHGERQSIGRVHVVTHTDTLAAIARRYHVDVAALARINRLANPNVIRDGQRLVIPGQGLVVNGRHVATDVKPLSSRQGRATAPLRPVMEALGGSVTWIAPTKTIHASAPQRGEVVITIGSSTAQVGDEKVLMDLAAYLDHNRAYLPVDFVSSALAVTIEIDPESGDILVRSK